ncbi:hypothetical protein FQR65_LT12244 [Abscondita terminalis]|nr:hypothetical protein FQR65_LT12244 [Abscondita terminalis]
MSISTTHLRLRSTAGMGLFYVLLCVLGQCASSSYNLTLYNNNIPKGTRNLLKLDQSLRTIFIIHGWQQSGQLPWVTEMKNAYFQTSSVNVIVLDWSEDASSLTYYPSVYVVPHIGRFLGETIYTLHSMKLIQVEATQLVGFSLGAHIAGIAAQTFTAKSNGTKIKIIVGLEAASPGYEIANEDGRLDATDAEFVQGFHTSEFGLRKPYATVDVYFNYKKIHGCGVKQPSCPWYPGVDVPPHSLYSTGKRF